MGQQRFSPEFKDEAVRQVLERGYTVKEVAERLGVASRSGLKCLALGELYGEKAGVGGLASASVRRGAVAAV
jgi:transposase